MPNPVPRVNHPDWLLRRLVEKTDSFKQRKLIDMFESLERTDQSSLSLQATNKSRFQTDIEQLVDEDVSIGRDGQLSSNIQAVITKHSSTTSKRTRNPSGLPKHWREQLGDPPSLDQATNRSLLIDWIVFHQKKWRIQLERRKYLAKIQSDNNHSSLNSDELNLLIPVAKRQCGMARYLNQTRINLIQSIWQVSTF